MKEYFLHVQIEGGGSTLLSSLSSRFKRIPALRPCLPPYHECGDPRMYTPEYLQKRAALKRNPAVKDSIARCPPNAPRPLPPKGGGGRPIP